MIAINAYKSRSLSDASFDRYGEAGAVKIVISTFVGDMSKDLNGKSPRYHKYADWKDFPLCLRSDWKLLKSWEIAEGDQLLSALEKEVSQRFCRPRILSEISDVLVSYADHLLGIELNRDVVRNGIDGVYCLGKDESDTLFFAYFPKDEGYQTEGYQRLFDAVLIQRIGGVVEDVVWEHNNL